MPHDAWLMGMTFCWAVGFTTTLAGSSGAASAQDATIHTDWRTFTTIDGLPHDSIRAVDVFDDQVWVGTDRGLALFERGEWSAWTQDDGLPVGVVMAVEVDPKTRDVWLGIWGGGLVRFSGGRFDHFNQLNSGLAGDLIFDVAVVGNRVWAATNGGVSCYDTLADTWDLYHPRRAHEAESVVTTLVTLGDDLYAGFWRGGVERFDSTTRRWESVITGRSGTKFLTEHADDAVGITGEGETLWLATQSAVLRWSNPEPRFNQRRTWSVWPIPGTQANPGFVQCVASPGNEKVWLGTDRGLYIFANSAPSTWLHLQSDQSLTARRADGRREERLMPSTIPDDRIRCIAFDGEVAWVGTAAGLARGENVRPWVGLPAESSVETPATPTATTADAAARVGMAIYGPRSRTIALPGRIRGVPTEPGRPDLLALEISIEQANARGGYRGYSPFELVMVSAGYSRYGWRLPEDDIVTFSQDMRVMGIVGYLIPDQRAAGAVVHRTEMPWLNVAPDVEEGADSAAANPWIFRCYGDQPRRHRMLMDHVTDGLGLGKVALLRVSDRRLTVQLEWWKSHAGMRRRPGVAETWWPPGPGEHGDALAALKSARPDVVVTWCDRNTTAQMLREMRAADLNQLVVVNPKCVDDGFVEFVGIDPGEVIALDPTNSEFAARENTQEHKSAADKSFVQVYIDRYFMGRGKDGPSAIAYRSHAATDHLLQAINFSDPDRESVRKTLEAMSRSSSGEAHYERLFKAMPVRFARLQGGKWVVKWIPTDD